MKAWFLWSLLEISNLCGTLILSMIATKKTREYQERRVNMNRLSNTVSNPRVETSKKGKGVARIASRLLTISSKLFRPEHCRYLTIAELEYMADILSDDVAALRSYIFDRKEEAKKYGNNSEIR